MVSQRRDGTGAPQPVVALGPERYDAELQRLRAILLPSVHCLVQHLQQLLDTASHSGASCPSTTPATAAAAGQPDTSAANSGATGSSCVGAHKPAPPSPAGGTTDLSSADCATAAALRPEGAAGQQPQGCEGGLPFTALQQSAAGSSSALTVRSDLDGAGKITRSFK